MKVRHSIIAVAKDRLLIYHQDGKLPEELAKALKNYGIEVEVAFTSPCG